MTDMFDIIPELTALEAHFRQPLAGGARDRWLVDWTRDLAEFSMEDIQRGCRWWRQNGERFPKPGELMRAIKQGLPSKQGGGKPVPWAPLSEDDYEALDLPAKIRHHRILAQEAYRAAGPMFRNTSKAGRMYRASGEHLTPDQLPDSWHENTTKARNHEAEAERLSAILRGHSPQDRFGPMRQLPDSMRPRLTPQQVAAQIMASVDGTTADEVVL